MAHPIRSMCARGGWKSEIERMVGKSKDPKGTRITVRISEKDLQDLQEEARRRNITVGAVVRLLIRERLGLVAVAR